MPYANKEDYKRWYKLNYAKGKGQGICIRCNKNFKKTRTVQKYCSSKCSHEARRKYFTIPDCLENPKRKIDKSIGYVRIYVPMHKEANTRGYVYEHRIIAEQMICRSLLPDEVVHHKMVLDGTIDKKIYK